MHYSKYIRYENRPLILLDSCKRASTYEMGITLNNEITILADIDTTNSEIIFYSDTINKSYLEHSKITDLKLSNYISTYFDHIFKDQLFNDYILKEFNAFEILLYFKYFDYIFYSRKNEFELFCNSCLCEFDYLADLINTFDSVFLDTDIKDSDNCISHLLNNYYQIKGNDGFFDSWILEEIEEIGLNINDFFNLAVFDPDSFIDYSTDIFSSIEFIKNYGFIDHEYIFGSRLCISEYENDFYSYL